MIRINSEYRAKLSKAQDERAKMRTNLAIYKQELELRKRLQKELDE